MSSGVFSFSEIKPFQIIGLTGPFWTLHLDILIATWIAMAIILVFVLIGQRFFTKELNLVSAGYETVISLFIDLCANSFQVFNYYYFAFITSIFFFTFFSSIVGIIPFVQEATMDLNTTLALALTSFSYVTYQKIKAHGIVAYCKEFIEPVFIFAPIHAVGELSKIASMSFRLFGNILGGSIILMMILEVLSHFKIQVMLVMLVFSGAKFLSWLFSLHHRMPVIHSIISFLFNGLFIITWVQIFFGIIEGLIQSFVLTMLTTTYLAIGVQHDDTAQEPSVVKDIKPTDNGELA